MSAMKVDCLFCKIVQGKIPATKIFEDSEVLGFEDINPHAPTHSLFIPKKHYASLSEIPEGEMPIMGKIFNALVSVARKKGLAEDGFRSVINTGKNGGQVVGHIHVHLIGGRVLGAMAGTV